VGLLFFLSLLMIGNFIMLNLFLAILLGNFQSDDGKETLDKEEWERSKTAIPSWMSKIQDFGYLLKERVTMCCSKNKMNSSRIQPDDLSNETLDNQERKFDTSSNNMSSSR